MYIRITNIPPYNGDFDATPPYNAREVNTFKRVANVLPAGFEAAIQGRDVGITVAYAVIALKRAGHAVNEDAIWEQWIPDDSPVGGKIELVIEESDAVPPPTPPQPPNESGPSGSSGKSSSTDGDSRQESHQSGTGNQPSETGSDSAPETLET